MPDLSSNLRQHPSLDSFDMRILAALQRDGRMTKVKLAEMVGLSPTPCGSRIERLEKAGLIRGYHADIDVVQLANLTRFRLTVSLRDWTPPKARRFEAALMAIPNIVECEAVLGDIDYLVTVLAVSVGHYQEIIGTLLTSLSDEIDFTTYPVSKSVKREADLALLKLSNREAAAPGNQR
ncbi:MAG: Lrp/AsnC family transcriptional regulator [Steroidobacteraceae bacterium]